MKKRHEYSYGIVGNCSFMSYIDLSANVVWQCWPSFDSSFVFGALLSSKKGGEFSITPTGAYTSSQEYLVNTNVLATTFKSSEGAFRVIDFAPRYKNITDDRIYRPKVLCRKIELLSGCPNIKVNCCPVVKYGELKTTAHVEGNTIFFTGQEQAMVLKSNIKNHDIMNQNSFILDHHRYLILAYGNLEQFPYVEDYVETELNRTISYWRGWVERSHIPNIYQEEVIRSALILKLHQYETTGAIIASGTTSLPEYPGHGRNWDYRYCWLRDSYFTLAALNNLGHFVEVEQYAQFIQQIVEDNSNQSQLYQPVYSIYGEKILTELEIDLEGYLNDRPVRVGNDAFKQQQHDVYGQILLTILPLYVDLRNTDVKRPNPSIVYELLNKIENVMEVPDAGIWEYRGKSQKHTVSYLFHWAGCLAANKIAKTIQDDMLKAKAEKIMLIAKENIENCFDHTKNAYGMSQENKNLNASEFLLITMNYLGHNNERALQHLSSLEKELKTSKEYIYRYRDHDDFGETHASFLICGFWYAEALCCVGRVDDARRIFEKLLKTSNHLGILSEDVCPQDDSQWGNFAQTYSHVGVINTAFRIANKLNSVVFLSE